MRAWLQGEHNNGLIDYGKGYMDYDPVITNNGYLDMEGDPIISVADVPIMLYTGKNDINDVEIYVGDIVRFKLGPSIPIFRIGRVLFDTKEACYIIKTNTKWGCNFNLAWYDCEVLGNQYEQPELLERVYG